MERPYCPYCGKSRVVHAETASRFRDIDEESERIHKEFLPADLYQCPTCNLQMTQLELDKEAEKRQSSRVPFGSRAAENAPSEEKTLGAAWELMRQSKWDEAFTVLFQQVSQQVSHYEQPLPFTFFRSICQVAPLLVCPANGLENRYQKLNILLNNLTCLYFYLAENEDREAVFGTLKKLYEALMLLGSLPIKRHANWVLNGPKYYTNQTRAAILSSFADYLEMNTLGDTEHKAEYFKMAVQLLHKCLELSREKNKLLPYHEYSLNLSSADRRQIEAKIKQLNQEIRRLDPGFTPADPLPAPRVYSPALDNAIRYFGWLFLYLAVSLLLVYVFVLATGMYRDMTDVWGLYGILQILVATFFIFYLASKKCSPKVSETSAGRQSAPALKTSGRSKSDPSSSAKQTSAPQSRRPCVYCGRGELLAPRDIHRNQYQQDIFNNTDDSGNIIIITDEFYRCNNCGICCSEAELLGIQSAAEQTSADSGAKTETEILDSAWQLMQTHRWDEALHLLDRQKPPYTQASVFSVCRKVCLAAPLLTSPNNLKEAYSLFSNGTTKCLKKRYEALDPLAESLSVLDGLLPQNDTERTFQSLKRIYEALQLLGSLPMKDLSIIVKNPESSKRSYYVDYTHHKRLAIADSFAAELEEKAQSDPEHRSAYLEMAVRLLAACATVTVKIQGEFLQVSLKGYSDNCYKQITLQEREQLENKIERINSVLSGISTAYTPILPPREDRLEDKRLKKLQDKDLYAALPVAVISLIISAAVYYYISGHTDDSGFILFCCLMAFGLSFSLLLSLFETYSKIKNM